MDRDINKKEQENTSSADVRISRTQHSMLVRKFVSVMEDYNSSQTIYKDKCKAQVKRQLAISGKHVLDSNELDYIVEERKTIFTQGHLSDRVHAKQICMDIEGRHAEIISLEASIKELHDKFVEMATMVELQGEVLDNIEMHCISALEYVAGSNEEIYQHIKLSKEKVCLRLKIIGIGSILSIILIIILICSIKFIFLRVERHK